LSTLGLEKIRRFPIKIRSMPTQQETWPHKMAPHVQVDKSQVTIWKLKKGLKDYVMLRRGYMPSEDAMTVSWVIWKLRRWREVYGSTKKMEDL
jgi:hypothetical protein